MKKNIGNIFAFYPTPVMVVGAVADGKPDYEKFKPVLFEMPNYTFLKTGETLGGCRTFMNNNIKGRS